jgi:histidinol phosphatase-like PHP family hydrolase
MLQTTPNTAFFDNICLHLESHMKINHDFHIHTNLSVCAKRDATLESYVEIGKELGLKKMGFSDHFWDENIPFTCNENGVGFYETQNFSHVSSIKNKVRELSTPEFKLYFGCEVEYAYGMKAPAITEAVAEQFDYIIVPISHTHLAMPEEFYTPYSKHVEFMTEAYESILRSPLKKHITAIAHPFEAVCCPYPREILFNLISDDDFKRIFSLSADAGIAVELNQECLMEAMQKESEWTHRLRMIGIAKDMGCKFLFGSDAHSHGHLKALQNANELANIIGLCEKDISDFAL